MNNEETSGLDKAFNIVEDTAEVIPKTNKLHLKKDEGDDVIKTMSMPEATYTL